MFNVKEIAFVGYPVVDLARARAFYEGVLKLKTGAVWEGDGKAWIEYDIGPGTLAITNSSADWKPSPGGPAAALEIDDFDAAVKAVRAAGVKFIIEPMETPVCWMSVIQDTEGNSLVLHHRKAG